MSHPQNPTHTDQGNPPIMCMQGAVLSFLVELNRSPPLSLCLYMQCKSYRRLAHYHLNHIHVDNTSRPSQRLTVVNQRMHFSDENAYP